MFKKYLWALWIGGLVTGVFGAEPRSNPPAESADAVGRASAESDLGSATNTIPPWRDLKRWSFQAGVGFITGSTIDEVATFQSELGKGDAHGQIYLMQVSYKAAELKPELFGRRFAVDVELPLVLGVVDEHGHKSFMQYSGGVTLRWKTLPWNRWLYTNFETGIGLTYSQHVLAAERERHPDRERSHLEIYWPVQLMVAHPRYREHQLVLFLHHHSGGGIFHTGGANTLGVAYRYVPGE